MVWVFWNWQFSLILVALVGQQAGRSFIGAASQDYNHDHNLIKLNLAFDVWKKNHYARLEEGGGNAYLKKKNSGGTPSIIPLAPPSSPSSSSSSGQTELISSQQRAADKSSDLTFPRFPPKCCSTKLSGKKAIFLLFISSRSHLYLTLSNSVYLLVRLPWCDIGGPPMVADDFDFQAKQK